jgi:hypothetical protein
MSTALFGTRLVLRSAFLNFHRRIQFRLKNHCFFGLGHWSDLVVLISNSLSALVDGLRGYFHYIYCNFTARFLYLVQTSPDRMSLCTGIRDTSRTITAYGTNFVSETLFFLIRDHTQIPET